MSLSALGTINRLFEKLKTNPEAEVSATCEQIVEIFPVLIKEEQKDFSDTFYNWAGKYKTRYPVIFCYARHLMTANSFFSEQHETVLAEAPGLQKAFTENNELAAVAAVDVLIGSIHRTLGNIDLS